MSCSVRAGSAAALICDTPALLDYLVETAPDGCLAHAVVIEIQWRANDLLVINNHRMLNARAGSPVPDTSRELLKVLVGV